MWNGPRAEFDDAPLKYLPDEESTSTVHPSQLRATFHNTGSDPQFDDAKLWYDEAGDFGALLPGKSIAVNTFEGHVWNIKAGDEVLQTIVITDEKVQQYNV